MLCEFRLLRCSQMQRAEGSEGAAPLRWAGAGEEQMPTGRPYLGRAGIQVALGWSRSCRASWSRLWVASKIS